MTSATKSKNSGKKLVKPPISKTARVASVPDMGYAKSYQHRQVGEYMDEFMLFDYAMTNRKNILIEGPTGTGKALSLTTPVLTPSGWVQNGDLTVGDYVVGSDGMPTRVIGVYDQGVRPAYRVTFNDGTSVVADGDHLWSVQTPKMRRIGSSNWKVLTTSEIIASGVVDAGGGSRKNGGYRWYLPLVQPVFHKHTDLPVHPYVLGVLLANGTLTSRYLRFTTNEEHIVKRVAAEVDVVDCTYHSSTAGQWDIRDGDFTMGNVVALGVYGHKSRTKFIPGEYMLAHEDDRLELLRALMDCDGSVLTNRRAQYHTYSAQLAEDVAELVRSLGGVASVAETDRDDAVEYTVSIWMKVNPFTLPRKRDVYAPAHEWFRAIESIVPVNPRPMRCIKVDAEDSLYVVKHYIVTHNTSAIVAWAAARHLHFYSVSSSNGVEPSQLFGRMIPDEDAADGRALKWQDGPVTDIVRHGGVLLINEINFIPERISTVLFSLLDKRQEIQLVDHKGEVIKAHKEFVVFADMNPDYEGTRALNKALRNRFPLQLVWDYDPKIEEVLIGTPALRTLAEQIRKQHQAGEFETPISTNMLIEFEEHYKYLGFEFAVTNFINHFTVDEREPIKVVFGTHRANLERDMAKIKRLTPYGHDLFDKEMGGVWGKDWSYEEEGA